MTLLRWGVFIDSGDCTNSGDNTKYVCAVARGSIRGILSGRQSTPVNKPVKCLDFYDKPYVREYVATEATLITWRTDFPHSYGSKRRGSRDPLTQQYCQKSLHAYAVRRLKAINHANGEGRIDDEKRSWGVGRSRSS